MCHGHVSEISIPDVTVCTVEIPYRDSSKIMCSIQISTRGTIWNMELMLDTGSAVLIIPMLVCT